MNERLRKHIDMLFEEAPKTRKTLELKEELYGNSVERYDDLVSDGIGEEDAYKTVIGSIGDITALFSSLDINESNNNYESEESLKKRALLKAISVGLYIFGGVMFLGLGILEDITPGRMEWSSIGLVIMLLIDIIPTCILVYIANNKPKYIKTEDTVIEEFKEWQSDKSSQKEIKRALSSILWSLTIVIYFMVSFFTWDWYITWVIFIAAFCVDAIIALLFSLKRNSSK